MRTTLNQIRSHHPCCNGWEKLLRGLGKTASDDDPLWLDTVLDHNGLDDALWCLRAVENCDREISLYAVWCAQRVLQLRAAQSAAEKAEWSAPAAWAAAWTALASASASAASAASASAAAVASDTRNSERAAQAEELRRICREMREAKP